MIQNIFRFILLSLFFKPTGLFFMFLQLFYMYHMFVTDDIGGFSFRLSDIGLITFSLFLIAYLYHLIQVLSGKRRWLITLNSLLFLWFFLILVAYHFKVQELLNWSVLVDNLSETFAENSLNVISSSLHIDVIYYGIVFTIMLLVLELFFRFISRGVYLQDHRRNRALGLFFVYVVLLFFPIHFYDPISSFFQSVRYHYRDKALFSNVTNLNSLKKHGMQFKYDRHTSVDSFNKPPHILLIQIESLNAEWVNKKVDGELVMPYLNSLQHQSLFVDRFYGNSIQTAKGHFATMFSMIPSTTGKVFVRNKDFVPKSFAHVLNQNGYRSIYFTAYKNLNFDNEYEFFKSRGFDLIESVDSYLLDDDRSESLRWGVRDKVFYERFFDRYLDAFKQTETPHFFYLISIANHFPFDSVPNHLKEIHASPNGIVENYDNSVRLVDNGIQYVFERLRREGFLKNTLVIITADHAFPLGLHKNYHLEAGYHEDSFRIPFFMVWDGVVPYKQLTTPYSQMDIGPTLVDLLDLNVEEHYMQGHSILRFRKDPIYLVQPYGKHLSIIDGWHKYRFFTKTRQMFLYDLKQDPMERSPIKLSPEQKKYSESLLRHFTNYSN